MLRDDSERPEADAANISPRPDHRDLDWRPLMADAAIRVRASHCNSPKYDVILSTAHCLGPLLAECAGYRIYEHPSGYEVATASGWHCHTAATYHDALDYICECKVLSHGQ